MSTHKPPRSSCSLLVHTWCLGKFLRPPDSAGILSWAGAWLEGREEEPSRLAITPFIHTWRWDNVVGVMEEVGGPSQGTPPELALKRHVAMTGLNTGMSRVDPPIHTKWMLVRPKISYNRILLWYDLQVQVGLPHAICQQLLGKK